MAYSIATWSWTPDTWNLETNYDSYLSLFKTSDKIYTINSLDKLIDTNLVEPILQEDFQLLGTDSVDKLILNQNIKLKDYTKEKALEDGFVYRVNVDNINVKSLNIRKNT